MNNLTMKSFRKWKRERRRKADEKKEKDQRKREFQKCKEGLRDLLIEYGRSDRSLRDFYKREGRSEGLKGFQLTSFINQRVKDDKRLNKSLIHKIALEMKCGDKNQALKPCDDDGSVKCSDIETYERNARRVAKTWTVSYLEDQIKKLERDTMKDEDDEELLEKYRERLETIEAPLQQNRRSRNSWGVEPSATTLKF